MENTALLNQQASREETDDCRFKQETFLSGPWTRPLSDSEVTYELPETFSHHKDGKTQDETVAHLTDDTGEYCWIIYLFVYLYICLHECCLNYDSCQCK